MFDYQGKHNQNAQRDKKCNTILHKAKEPKGEKAHYQANQGPSIWRTRPKPKQAISNQCQTPQAHSRRPKKTTLWNWSQGGPTRVRPQLGCGRTPAGSPLAQPSQGGAFNGMEDDAVCMPGIFAQSESTNYYIRRRRPPTLHTPTLELRSSSKLVVVSL
jgi:hypothetical protein